MKRLAIIIATALCLVGCRKEQPKHPFVGRWYCEDVELYIDGVLTEAESLITAWIFNEDGSGGFEMTGRLGEYVKPFEWVTDFKQIGITYPNANEYEISEEIYDILDLDGVWMQVKYERDQVVRGETQRLTTIFYITKTQ